MTDSRQRDKHTSVLSMAALIALFTFVAGCSSTSKPASSSTGPVLTIGITSTTSGPSAYGTIRIGPDVVVPDVPVEQLPLGRAGCSPPSPIGNTVETRGTTNGAQLFGLFMGPHLPIRVGDQVKIVWRMTGHGPLVATATSPTGGSTPLLFFAPHTGSSTYHRHGDEWGIGYGFTQAGCWHLHSARSDMQGDAWFNVVAGT